jgi:DNA-binding transcriptional LysR family regulator
MTTKIIMAETETKGEHAMNLLHLKYVLEVAKTSSITKAAENLYMAQPNLSRAIKELEDSLGIEIFRRTSTGITLTPPGAEFLEYAKSILSQVDAVEKRYGNEKTGKQIFAIAVPRASYISCAFTEFVKKLEMKEGMEIIYKEMHALETINNVLNDDYYKLGIIRYRATHDKYYKSILSQKGLNSELICESNYVIAMSEKHPLAASEFSLEELERYPEIVLGDTTVSSPLVEAKREEISEYVNRRIVIYERGSQYDLLSEITDSFMWSSPIPDRLLKRFGLVMRSGGHSEKIYKDVLIYNKGYRLSKLDLRFIDELMDSKRKLAKV